MLESGGHKIAADKAKWEWRKWEGKGVWSRCGRKKARRVEDQGVKRPIRGRGGLGQRCGQIGEYVRMAGWLFRGELSRSPGSTLTNLPKGSKTRKMCKV